MMDDLTFEVDDALLEALRLRAEAYGRTVEEEARHLILRSLDEPSNDGTETAVSAFARMRTGAGGGVDLEVPERPVEPFRPFKVGS